MDTIPLIVIVGPTASGKTDLSITLAQQYGGEVISADSRAIYKGMNIGTAKPSELERRGVPHWGFDLAEPGQRFTAADYQRYALNKIKEIKSRGKYPILVGGTGLYINSVIYKYSFTNNDLWQQRDRWEKLSIDDLHQYCFKNNIVLPENRYNKRYVINTILRNGADLKREHMPGPNTVIVGITTDRVFLRNRISARIDKIFSSGVIEETYRLAKLYGWQNEAMTGNIYDVIRLYALGEIDLPSAKQLAFTKDWRLAKRQLTWFKRDEHIKWFDLDKAYTFLAQQLVNLNKL